MASAQPSPGTGISELPAKRTYPRHGPNDAIDLGCVKTPQARERLELFFPDRPKSIAHNDLRSEIRNRKDDPFYQISTLRRFHTTKTHTRSRALDARVAAMSQRN